MWLLIHFPLFLIKSATIGCPKGCVAKTATNYQQSIAEVELRTQGSRPRTQKKSEAKASLFREQTLSWPRPRTKDTNASALQKKKKGLHNNFSDDLQKKKKKRSSQKFFKRSPQKNVFQKIFQALHKILTIQKILLSSSRGQANFRGLEASRPRTSKYVLKDVLEGSTSGE